jgi:hypothetical protein
MPQCEFPVFCCFCVSEKLHKKYSQNWTKQKQKFLFFSIRDGVQSRDRGGPEGGHTPHGTEHPLAVPVLVWAPGPPPDIALSPIYSPRWENPKPRSIFQKTYCKPPPLLMQDREGPEALLGILPERGITTGGLLHHHACLQSDVWVVYLGLRVHSSS